MEEFINLNYVMVLLLFFFMIHILVKYRLSSSNNGGSLVISKVILIAMAIIGHGTIIANVGYTETGYRIVAFNAMVLFCFMLISHYIHFLEPVIWHIIAMLHLIGSIMLHRLSPELALKHNILALLGFALMLLVGFIVNKIAFFSKMTYLYMAVAIGLLLIVNSTTYGATNWFSYGNFSFQPSEFVKIVFAFYLASAFKKEYEFIQLLIGSVVSAVIVLILVYQRDLGSALLFFSLYMVLSYMYSRKRWMSFAQLGAFSVGAYLSYTLFAHVRTRIYAWQDPWAYIDNEGYQVTQGLFAFASGKWMGTGLTLGQPTKIPVVTTDFIYAAIGEEFGSIFAILLIFLYLILIITLLSQCQKTYSLFNAYVGVGLVVMFGFQGFLIIGGVIKLIPLTGVTLPFVSYGGTSLIATILSIGIIEAITKAKHHLKEREYRAHTIVTIKGIMFFLYSALAIYLMYFLIFNSDQLQLNTYNSRLDQIEENILRGSIYDSTGRTLAYSSYDGDEIVRYYPFAAMYAHAIGYSQIGKTGIEANHNVDLLNPHFSFLEQFKWTLSGQGDKGSDVYISLDHGLQEIAYEALGDRKGAILAMEPSTGRILAMVSKPDYNPNTILSEYEELIQSDEGVLLNRTTQGLYPPGSTFKILTLLEYIHENGEEFNYFCKGRDIFGNKFFSCYGDTAHGRVNAKDALAQSCNTAFATMGESIDMRKLEALANSVLFNKELPYDYYHQTSSFLLPETVSPELRAETVIGQGETLITPLHNMLVFSAIANGGVLMKPYLVEEIRNPYGDQVKKMLPTIGETIFDSEDTAMLKEYLLAVVEEGTGKGLISEQYTAAGKTGAAENPFGDTHAWFVGFAPYDNPQIVVSIIVENAGSSSSNSVPIAKDLFDYYLNDK